jgi:hypothetical protein
MWFVARSGWILLGMIATSSTSSYGWLPLCLQTKFPKETTLLCWHNPRVFTDNYKGTLQHIQGLDTNATIYSLVLTMIKIHTNLQYILAFWITLAWSLAVGYVRVIWQCSGVLSIHVGFPLPSSVAVQRPYQENFDIDSTRKCIQRLGRGRACTCCGCLLAQGPTGLIISMHINLLRTVVWRWKLYFHELWQ